MSILVYGSVAYDQIMDFPDSFSNHILPGEIKKLNVSFTVRQLKKTFGGTAGNIAYNLSLLKEKPVVYSAVGSDFDPYRERMAKLGINLSGIKVYNKTLTASVYIITDKDNNQISGFFPGALQFYGHKPKPTKKDLAVIAPGNPVEMLNLAEDYAKKRTFFIFDPGQQLTSMTKAQLLKAIKLANIYIVNDYELSLTKKITGHGKEDILERAGVLITTLGAKGSKIELSAEGRVKEYRIRAVKSKKIADPTGAGDAYRAGLIKGLRLHQKKNLFKTDWLKIGQIASLAGTYAAEQYGTQNHEYTFEQFKQRFTKEFNINLY